MNAKVIGTGQGRGHRSKWLSEFKSSIVVFKIFKLLHLIKKWQRFKSFDLCKIFSKIVKIQNAAISLLIGII